MNESSGNAPVQNAWHVLHVDDDEDDFLITREMLSQSHSRNIILEWASTYEDGRAMIQAKRYDAVLIDYDLGVRTGIDFIRETVSYGYHPPLILFTGRGTYEVDIEALKAGATLYITKAEVNPMLLERSIRYAVERLRLEQERSLILDSILDGFFALDRNWQFVFLNRRAANIVGAEPKDLVGRNIWEAYPALLGTPIEHHYRLAMEERKPVNFEMQSVYEDQWFDISVYPFHEGISVYWQDITDKRKAEDELRKSEARFRAVFERAEIGIAVGDINGHIVDSNPALERMLGYSKAELHQMTFTEYTHPEDAVLEWSLVGELRSGVRDHYEIQKRYIRKDGQVVPVRLIGSIVRNRQGEPILGVVLVEDITKRLLAERESQELVRSLELSRSRLAAILESLPVGIWIGDEHGRLVGKNLQADHIWAGDVPLAESVQEYTQYTSWFADSGNLLQPEEYPISRVLQTGQLIGPVELNILRLDGSPGTVLASAAPIKDSESVLTGVVGVNVDITDRKQMEERLRLSEERFSKAFNATPNALVLSRMRDGRIDMINDSFEQLFGYTREEVIGKTSLELNMFADPAAREAALQTLNSNHVLRNFEISIRLRSYEARQVQLSIEVLSIGGEPYLLTVIDDHLRHPQPEGRP